MGGKIPLKGILRRIRPTGGRRGCRCAGLRWRVLFLRGVSVSFSQSLPLCVGGAPCTALLEPSGYTGYLARARKASETIRTGHPRRATTPRIAPTVASGDWPAFAV